MTCLVQQSHAEIVPNYIFLLLLLRIWLIKIMCFTIFRLIQFTHMQPIEKHSEAQRRDSKNSHQMAVGILLGMYRQRRKR